MNNKKLATYPSSIYFHFLANCRGKLVGLLIAILMAGCTSVPMANNAEDISAKQLHPVPEKAVVYIFRESQLAGYAQPFPVAVENKVIGWLVHESYLRIELEPGAHTFGTVGNYNTFKGFIGTSPAYIEMGLEKNHVYFLNLDISVGIPIKAELQHVQPGNPSKALASLKLTRFDSRSLRLSDLQHHELITPQNEKPAKAPAVHSQSAQPASREQLNSFLEVLGAVLFFSIAIFAGVEATHANAAPNYIQPPIYEQTAIIQKAASTPAQSKTLLTTNGDIIQVSGNRVYSPTSGAGWTVNGNTISGTDGSRYHVSSGRIFSEDGRAYSISDNTLLGDDGSVCSVTGTLINCR